ncbi:TonB-dependent receptor [Gaoshiqia sp. Z1-71]|uniref:TonB-dependent receptor n=1 Tax=Gaoshiqia hydrogeniformans TaxID=3290090 RepID=UPI003BF89356
MRLTFLFVFAGLMQLSASVYSQHTRLNLSLRNTRLEDVLQAIEKQSEYRFAYSAEYIDLDKQVNVTLSDKPIAEVLEVIFEGTNIKYRIDNRHVMLFSSEQTVKPSVFQQVKGVSGQVKDTGGEPLPGVTVVIKGSSKGTITDINGNFNISDVSPDAVLLFSFIGMKPVELPVGSQSVLNIKMEVDAIGIEEVVAVGYGTQKKATLTGSVEQVTSKSLESRAVTNVALALQGETPGLVVTRSTPRPGNEGIKFQIRGATSVNGGAPLLIVDGVPVINNGGTGFDNLNMDDIESMSVLKDGAASIYGAKAANGVILVTTKRGKGKVKVDYTGNVRFSTNGIIAYSPDMKQYATMWIEANKEETVPNWWVWQNEQNMLKMQQGYEGAYDLFGIDYFIFNANRLDEMFGTRYSYQHNLSISNSTDKSGYRISVGYADNQGNLLTAYDGQKQYNFRLNYDYQLTEKLKLETNLSVIDAKTSSPSVGLDNTLYGYDMPFFPAKNPYGQWFACFNGVDAGANRNAAAMTTDGGRDDKNSLVGRIDVKATYAIFKDLDFEALASLQNERYDQEKYVLQVPVYNWYGVQTGIGNKTGGTNNMYSIENKSNYSQYYSALLRYTKSLNGMHNISAVAGIVAEKNSGWKHTEKRIGFEDMGVYDIGLASIDAVSTGSGKWTNGTYSYLARVNYDYKEKYLATFQVRSDGDSRFATGYKFKNFASASAGWVFSNEDFFSSLAHIVNFGKIRISYGNAGNNAGLGDFDYYSLINTGSVVLGTPAALQNSSTLANNGLISRQRTWERVEHTNAGIDLRFLNGRLSSSFDVFEKNNIGMLSNVTYPSVLGGTAPKTNSGHFNTKGWEAILSWNDRVKDFNYNIAVSMSDTKTRVTNVEGADNYGVGKNGIVNGYPYKPWFVYKTDGYFKDQAEVDAYYVKYGASDDLASLPAGSPNVALRPGDIKKVDVAGTGNITSTGNEKSSLVYAGDGTPHYTFGLKLGASWKGFDFNAFFQGQLKQNIMRSAWMAYPFQAIWTNQNPAFLGNTWTEEYTDAPFPRLTVNPTRAKWNYANNDFMLQNNRYIRLKSLIVGYTLPQRLTSKAKLDRVRVYFSGNDLWESTSIKDGFDPEMGEASVDDNGYPYARTWSFGVNIGF